MRITRPAIQPFSLPAVARSHGWHQLAPFSYDQNTEILSYIDRLPSDRVIDLNISPFNEGVAVLCADDLKPDEIQQVKSHVTWMLGLDQDLSEFHRLARQEPKLKRAAEKASGRILRSPTLFEDLVKTILTTNTTWGGTIRMNRNLVEQFGDPLPDDPSRRAFPSPKALARVNVETLRSETKLGYRAPYIRELAQAVSDGSLDLTAFTDGSLTTDQLRKRLLAIKGVGAYAAANLMMLLGHYDDLPVDSWALKMVSQEWHGGEPVGPAEVYAAFERWGLWRGLAYWFWEWDRHSEGA